MVFTMAKCIRCNVTVNDETDICPLCRSPLMKVTAADQMAASSSGMLAERSSGSKNKYPKARTGGFGRFIKSMGFAMILIACILIIEIDLTFFEGFIWFPIPVAAIVYAYMIFRYGVMAGGSHQAKIIILTTFSVLFLILVDLMTGFNRWSVNYIIPAGILTADMIMMISMLVNRRNRQSYVVPMLIIIVISLVPELLWWLGIITKPMLSWIAMIVTIVVGFASMLINEYRSFNEIKRRFHISRK